MLTKLKNNNVFKIFLLILLFGMLYFIGKIKNVIFSIILIGLVIAIFLYSIKTTITSPKFKFKYITIFSDLILIILFSFLLYAYIYSYQSLENFLLFITVIFSAVNNAIKEKTRSCTN